MRAGGPSRTDVVARAGGCGAGAARLSHVARARSRPRILSVRCSVIGDRSYIARRGSLEGYRSRGSKPSPPVRPRQRGDPRRIQPRSSPGSQRSGRSARQSGSPGLERAFPRREAPSCGGPSVRNLPLTVLAVLLLPHALGAQTNEPNRRESVPVAQAAQCEGVIRLDGRLDEADWAKAAVTESFTQLEPDEGKPSSQRTEVRVLYDGAFLYVGAQLRDAGPITGRLGRRDMDAGDSDWFRVFLDSYHDHRTAFGLEVNPAGVRRDEIRTIDVDDNTWDPVWDVATRLDSAGWAAEFRIPFSQLRFSGAHQQNWGLQFQPVIGRNREAALSTFIPKS